MLQSREETSWIQAWQHVSITTGFLPRPGSDAWYPFAGQRSSGLRGIDWGDTTNHSHVCGFDQEKADG